VGWLPLPLIGAEASPAIWALGLILAMTFVGALWADSRGLAQGPREVRAHISAASLTLLALAMQKATGSHILDCALIYPATAAVWIFNRRWARIGWVLLCGALPSVSALWIGARTDALLPLMTALILSTVLINVALRTMRARHRALMSAIHDTVGQELTLLALEGDRALARGSRSPEAAALHVMTSRIRLLLRSTERSLSSPDGVDGPHLEEEVEKAVCALTGTNIFFRIEVHIPVHSAELQGVLAGLLREAVTNLLRHAGSATEFHFTATLSGDRVHLSFGNDGAPPPPLRMGLGMTGMRDRVTALGGFFTAQLRDDRFLARGVLPAPRPALRLAGREAA
jgi:two-component system sensor histidine kinase DesK